MKYLVGFQLQVAGKDRQIGVSVIRWRRERLDQAGKDVGGDMFEDQADAGTVHALDGRRSWLRALRHAGIDAVDELPERWIEAIARVRQVDLDLGSDAAGIG